MSWLADLGILHGATVHVEFGPNGADHYLAAKHSQEVNKSWIHYFDLAKGCGIFPFNEVQNFEGCKIVDDPYTDFNYLFEDGSRCVNIVQRRWFYKTQYLLMDNERRCDIWGRGLAGDIYKASKKFRADHKVPEHYGAYHIRRCDRINTNGVCTEVDVVKSMIANETSVQTWLMFTYAEQGYMKKLKKALKPLTKGSRPRRFIFEDDVELDPYHSDDNYITFLVANDIILRAPVRVETQYCKENVGRVYTRPYITTPVVTRIADEREAMDSDSFGVCGGK